jgi:hypothetical protein
MACKTGASVLIMLAGVLAYVISAQKRFLCPAIMLAKQQ